MGLPVKDYYTLTEVAKRWGCEPTDVLHYGATRRLTLCADCNGWLIESGFYSTDKDFETSTPHRTVSNRLLMCQGKTSGAALTPINPVVCVLIERDGIAHVLGGFADDNGELMVLRVSKDAGDFPPNRRSQGITIKDLCVTNEEILRFERDHGITFRRRNSSCPGTSIPPVGKINDDVPHGNTEHFAEHFAKNRVEILGAAFSVLATFPAQCKDKNGKVRATRLRGMIEEKALLFWPDTGTPPLQSEPIERLLREWLKKTGE